MIPPALALVLVVLAAACGRDRDTPGLDVVRASGLFDVVEVDTANGLSGLAVDESGALWAIAERAERAYRITLDGALRPTVEAVPVRGVPPGTDLEGIAVLGGDRFALGTEGRVDGIATVLAAERRDGAMVVTGAIPIPASALGVTLRANHGAEGVCGAGDTIVAAIETVATEGNRRWAPIVRIEHGAVARVYRLWLTTATGKIAGLDCRLEPDGAFAVWAVERHFEVTRLLRFRIAAGDREITPDVLIDLGPILRGALNLEGIAAMPDGRIAAVVDNQWKTITGPNELLVFRPDALRRR